jgi:hypothetical protein
MKEGMVVNVTEPVEDNLGTDAGFPVGKAKVTSVSEETSVMELFSVDGGGDPLSVEIKKSFSISRPLDAPERAESKAKRR